jgi:hypothetical protein
MPSLVTNHSPPALRQEPNEASVAPCQVDGNSSGHPASLCRDLANRDKQGPNYWLEPRDYDKEEFVERWGRIGSGLE